MKKISDLTISAVIACYKDGEAIPIMHSKLTNVFKNEIKQKIKVVDHKNISKKDEISLNDKVKAIFSNKL